MILIIKAVVYRMIRILLLWTIALIILDNPKDALTISLVDAIAATIYYYYFDKIWSHIEIRYSNKKIK